MDYSTLDMLRRQHPAWRLLAADHVALIASFLYRTFVQPNIRVLSQPELISRLEDYLYHLRISLGEEVFPKPAGQYLDDWAGDERGWLRKFYPPGEDDPHFDLTPATEKAIDWLVSLGQRQFVGTESRLLTVFELLRQMVEGTETDPEARIAELERRKAQIDAEIERIRSGQVELMDATQLKDRFLQVAGTARGLLTDFREVEQNFRTLDRLVRERIALWEGGKGDLLEEIFGQRDVIADSDQGRSFRAFWDFLMSPARQEELSTLLAAVFELEAVRALEPDRRLMRVHYDWLEAGEHTQRTVARLSQQLRRYLDDKAWLDNRRIMQILHEVEANALAVRDAPPEGLFMELSEPAPVVELPMERPLYSPPVKPVIAEQVLQSGDAEIAADALFDQVYVDKARLAGQIRRALQTRRQIALPELLAEYPLEQGLAELVAYLSLASEDHQAVIDDDRRQIVRWVDPEGHGRQATLPLIIFSR